MGADGVTITDIKEEGYPKSTKNWKGMIVTEIRLPKDQKCWNVAASGFCTLQDGEDYVLPIRYYKELLPSVSEFTYSITVRRPYTARLASRRSSSIVLASSFSDTKIFWDDCSDTRIFWDDCSDTKVKDPACFDKTPVSKLKGELRQGLFSSNCIRFSRLNKVMTKVS